MKLKYQVYDHHYVLPIKGSHKFVKITSHERYEESEEGVTIWREKDRLEFIEEYGHITIGFQSDDVLKTPFEIVLEVNTSLAPMYHWVDIFELETPELPTSFFKNPKVQVYNAPTYNKFVGPYSGMLHDVWFFDKFEDLTLPDKLLKATR